MILVIRHRTSNSVFSFFIKAINAGFDWVVVVQLPKYTYVFREKRNKIAKSIHLKPKSDWRANQNFSHEFTYSKEKEKKKLSRVLSVDGIFMGSEWNWQLVRWKRERGKNLSIKGLLESKRHVQSADGEFRRYILYGSTPYVHWEILNQGLFRTHFDWRKDESPYSLGPWSNKQWILLTDEWRDKKFTSLTA